MVDQGLRRRRSSDDWETSHLMGEDRMKDENERSTFERSGDILGSETVVT